MNAFYFARKRATVTVTPTPPGDHVLAATFTAPAEDTILTNTAFAFPFGFSLSRGVDAAVHALLDRDDNECGGSSTGSSDSDSDSDSDSSNSDSDEDKHGASKSHPGSKTKKLCGTTTRRTASTTRTATVSSPSPQSPTLSPTPLPPPSLPPSKPTPAPTHSGGSISQIHSSTTTDLSLTSTPAGRSDAVQSSQSQGSGMTEGSVTSVPPENLSTQAATIQPSPSSGLSAGAAVGIALGVFAGAMCLVAGAVFLFLFLRRRKRKRRHRGSATSSTRELKSGSSDIYSEGAPSRPPSSTWSWFGSVAIGSDSESEHRFQYRTRDDGARNSRETEKSASLVGEWVARTSPAVGDASEHASARAPRLREPASDGESHIRPVSVTDVSVSTLRFDPPGEARGGGKGAPVPAPRDPFADLPPIPAIARMLTAPSLT
ncbi:hypothetical protein GSI_08567 [Ganoderma sinense ZZ0214-1]|uniref:Uncharacterized protein n=1 Tax=Ganoderma sinense ZZ0214-1 TaxID=1077348 RepID=A0A2G8S426_9APHY|nr:hypothetical protein GSI_08567 [Ganoderma sinense ZZ0214-1]